MNRSRSGQLQSESRRGPRVAQESRGAFAASASAQPMARKLLQIASVANFEMSRSMSLAKGIHTARNCFCVVLGALLSVMTFETATSDTFPSRAVHVVIPYSPGGSPDVVFRVIAQELQSIWKQSVILENKAGGNTIPGALAVSRAPADGYTLLFTTDGTFLLNPLVISSLPYAMSDFTPVLLVATAPHMVAVSKQLNVNSVFEFVKVAKETPEGLRYGSTGSISLQRLAMDHFAHIAGIKLTQIPYKGAPETTTAVLTGEVSASVNSIATILPLVQAGSIRTIGVAAKARSPLAPDVPTFQEQGIPNFSSQGMFGLFAPANIPVEVREKIRKDILDVTGRAAIKSALEARGYEVRSEGAEEFKELIASEASRWEKIMKDLDVK